MDVYALVAQYAAAVLVPHAQYATAIIVYAALNAVVSHANAAQNV